MPAESLLARLAVVEREVAQAVARRRPVADGRNGGDPHGQGLFITPGDVAALLHQAGPTAAPSGDTVGVLSAFVASDYGPEDRCSTLQSVFGLEPADLAILMVALAPDVDPRFEGLYGYLNDDVTSRRATVALCLELCGLSLVSTGGRSRFRGDAPLLRHRLVELDDGRPWPGRALRVCDRVIDHLLGDDRPDPIVAPLVLPPLTVAPSYGERVRAAVARGVRLVYLRGQAGHFDHASAAGALVAMELPVLQVDLSAISPSEGQEVAAAIAREAGLQRSALVAGPVDDLAVTDGRAVAALARAPVPVVLLGSRAWEPGWSQVTPLLLDVEPSPEAEVAPVWRDVLGADLPADLAAASATFRLTPHQVLRAAVAARAHASASGGTVDTEAVRAGARAQNGGALESLARRVHPRATTDDLILAEPAASQVLEVATRARLRSQVLGAWRMGGVGTGGDGITALFSGPSGTGKTLAAEVIAGSLGLDLFVVDLSSVVDKYVGETEKNLERIFRGAAGLNGVLFFDEADALFGKRSAVSDGHDRYANIEIAYLLQRMEQFDGISVLATNLSANLDDAFARRIDVRVVFPSPEAGERRRLWDRHLPPTVPTSGEVDLGFLGDSFRLSGGDIRNAALAAAYDAAARAEPVGMVHLVRAVAREYRKLGRLCTEEEFGPYTGLLAI